MFLRRQYIGGCLGLSILLSTLAIACQPQGLPSSKSVIQKDSMEVRHLVLKGSNEEIGRTLAQIAMERYQAKAQPSPDRLLTRVQRRYIQKNYPIMFDRMHGAATAFGHQLDDDDAWNFSSINVTELKAGCSIFHLPPQLTTAAGGVVSRDYDYSTGSLTFGFLPPGQMHPTARPYLVELHPDRGYASLAMVAYDFLGCALDGMNSEGLTVALALDDEMMTKYSIEPTHGPAVGLGISILRYLLDTCGNATEAKEALLLTKQYYEYIPCHFLIADRFGNSFVWEYSAAHNKEYIIENPNQPLVMTNFSLHRHMDNGKPPSIEQAKTECSRYCRLTAQLASHPEKMSEEFIKATHKKADAETPAAAEPHRPPVRTFWHALYYPGERRMQISFYLRDEEIAGQPNKVKVVRSDYLEFRLPPSDTVKAPVAELPSTVVAASTSPRPAVKMTEAQQKVVTTLKNGGAGVRIEDRQVTAINLDKANDLASLLPLLQQLPEIAGLSIRNPKMDDAGVASLKGLRKLSLLNLGTSAVGDEGLKVLATLPRLRELNLGTTKVTDAGLAHLATMTQLEVLLLSGNPITDQGMAQLKNLTNMLGLFLGGTNITDASLVHLKGMSRLTKLNLSKTKVTDEGVANIKKSLPSWIVITKEKP